MQSAWRKSEQLAVFGMVVPFVIAIWAALDDVTQTRFFWKEGTFSWSLSLFWSAVFLSTVLSVVGFLVARKERTADDFERRVDDSFRVATMAATQSLSLGGHSDTYEVATRTHLMGVASLAEYWDTGVNASRLEMGPGSPRYAANLMYFLPIEETDFASLSFNDSLEGDLLGSLHLRPENACASWAQGQIDETLVAFALPVHRDLAKALPGGPKALRELSPVSEDVDAVIKACDEGRYGAVVSPLLGQFAQTQRQIFRSWVSVSLLDPNSGEPVGVLNIHSPREGTLGSESARFFTAIFVFQRQLAQYAVWLRAAYNREVEDRSVDGL